MFYELIKTPVVVKTGHDILRNIDELLLQSHLYYPHKTLVTSTQLYESYIANIDVTIFDKIIIIKGGFVDEEVVIKEQCLERNTLLIAFGGGSILDVVKYTASKLDIPYITIPSTLSNDAIYSCVSRLISDGKKVSLGVNPPIGIIVDFEIIKKSPPRLILAGVADLYSNISAIDDWLLANKNINEPINELAFMLAKQAAIPILDYEYKDLITTPFLFDLTNGLITSGLSMIISQNTRGTSGSEHLISHAIDEFYPEKATIHGIQVGWAHIMIELLLRQKPDRINKITSFYKKIGLYSVIDELIPWSEDDFFKLIPYALKIRNRYTILNTL